MMATAVVFWIMVMVPYVRGTLDTSTFKQQVDNLANEILGSSKYQKYLDHDVTYNSASSSPNRVLEKLSSDLSKKISDHVAAISALRNSIQEEFEKFTSTAAYENCCKCCPYVKQNSYNLKFHTKDLDTRAFCHTGQGMTLGIGQKYPNQAVLDRMKKNLEDNPNLKWQYFGGEDGVSSLYPASKVCDPKYDPRYRPWYSHTALPSPKDVVIVIDRSGSMSAFHHNRQLLTIAKEAANTVIDSMNPDDRVGVVFFSTMAETKRYSCHESKLALVTSENKNILKNYVNQAQPNGDTYYSRAFDKAFKLFSQSSKQPNYDARNRVKVILFLTDGRPSDRDYLDVIRRGNAALNNSVVILTFAFGYGIGADESQILTHIAEQISSDPSEGNITAGRYIHVLNPSNLRYQMARYYDFFSSEEDTSQLATLAIPYLDAFGLGLITSICLSVHVTGTFRGVTCIDITLSDLFSEATFFSRSAESYAFIMDSQTRLLIHPLLPRPTDVYDHPVTLRLQDMEVEPDIEELVKSTQKKMSGNLIFTSRRVLSRGDSEHDGVTTIKINSHYAWRPLGLAQLTICVVLAVSDQKRQDTNGRTMKDFPYHRLDLLLPQGRCRYINRQAITDTSTIKLAPFAFSSPDSYMETNETVHLIESYRQYFTSSDEGSFQDGVKYSAAISDKFADVISKTDDAWQSSVWRSLGLKEGVFRLYPGSKLVNKYDHTVRPWHKRAVAQKTLITFSKPYVDAFGAGIVITLSKAMLESNPNPHPSTDATVGSTGMDFTMDLFNSHLEKYITGCQSHKCFIIDNGGYIIIHPDFEGVTEEEIDDIGSVHITQNEERIAAILVDNHVMKKDGCINYDKRQVQTFWRVTKDTFSYAPYFEMQAIEGTNVFVVDVERNMTGFSRCICKTEKGSSIPECLHGPSRVCQCPCYNREDLKYDQCSDMFEFETEIGLLPPCTPPTPSVDLTSVAEEEQQIITSLKYCYPVNEICPQKKKQLDCAATSGCRWCSDCRVRTTEGCTGWLTWTRMIFIVVPSAVGVITVIIVLCVVTKKIKRVCKKKSNRCGTYPPPSDPPPPYSLAIRNEVFAI